MALVPPGGRRGAVPGQGGDPSDSDVQLGVLCRTAVCALMLVDDSRRYVRLNDDAEEVLGAPRKAILDRRIDQFTPPENLADLELFWATFERDGRAAGDGIVMRGDGTKTSVEFRAHWSFAPHRHLFAVREVRLPARPPTASREELPRLTAREQEVLQLSAEGWSTDEIADQLAVGPGTIKTHLHHIYGKLGARDRVSAVAIALRHGFIS